MTALPTVRLHANGLSGGETVPRLGQGTWQMAEKPALRKAEIAALRLGIELGMTLIDTAEMYASGGAEELTGEAIAGRRDDLFLVSKVLPSNSSRKGTVAACERSLKRLRTDWVDVLLVHWPDAGTPFDETMRALDEVVRSGRVRFVGVSNFTGAMIEECLRTRRVDVSQVGYHMLDRRQETETFPVCQRHGIGVMGYGAIASEYNPQKQGHNGVPYLLAPQSLYPPKDDWVGVLEAPLTNNFDSLLNGALSHSELIAGKYNGWTPIGAASAPAEM